MCLSQSDFMSHTSLFTVTNRFACTILSRKFIGQQGCIKYKSDVGQRFLTRKEAMDAKGH